MADLSKLVQRQSAPARGDLRSTVNRPLMPDHAKTIESYLVTNAETGYILPSITLTVATDLSVYTVRSPSPLRSAWVVLRSDTQFLVTDGQHRLVALTGSTEPKSRVAGALSIRPELSGDGVAIHLVFEKDYDRIHQDFADAARTKQIPPSMLAAYNMREPFNKVLLQVVAEAELLRDRIDMSSKTLGKRSQKLFLLNQVRGFLKELIMGDYAAAEEAVAKVASEQLAMPQQQAAATKRAVELIQTLSTEMSPWRQILELPDGGPEANKIPGYREEYLNMTATGLNIIGRIGHVVFNNAATDLQLRSEYFARLANLDWRKAAPFWSGTVISEGSTKVITNRLPLDSAFHRVRKEVKISSDWLSPGMRRRAETLETNASNLIEASA
ncbi:MAG: DNA sulfur modification protein DndB [Chloroflexota bacterium]|nr:DNA sulfur modification protein DndB [Chloroflexota bacterium]